MTGTIPFPEPTPPRLEPTGRFEGARDRDGCDDLIVIRGPDGRELAEIRFWDEPDTDHAERAEADARMILHRLNLYDELVKALQDAEDEIKNLLDDLSDEPEEDIAAHRTLATIREALAKAAA